MADNNFPYTNLDGNQIIQRSFEEATDRIRVDAEVTATIGVVDVNINADDGDNIAISDGTNTVSVTPAGELKVNDASSSAINAKLSDNYGTSTVALRTASQIGNTTGPADFNTGISGAQTLRSTSNTNDGAGTPITSASYSNNTALHTQVPDNVTSATALGALNAFVSISLAGLNSVGFQINPGTFIGTLTAQSSIDGGTNWTNSPFYDPENSSVITNLTFISANTLDILSIIPIGGSSNIRVMVTNYVSGSATGLLRAANVAGAAGAITAAAFGTVVNTTVSIPNNTPTLILNSNINRKYAYFGNSSGSTIRIQFFSSTGLNSTTGIPIGPSTGFYELKGDNLFTGNVYAFSSSDVQISVTEGSP